MNALDTEILLSRTLEKIASRKQAEKKEEKKEEKPMKDKGDDCKYAMKIAESLDYLLDNSEVWLGSPMDRILSRSTKIANSDSVPNMLASSESSGPDGKRINEHRDSMAVGEEPSAKPEQAKGKFEGVPNMVHNTAEEKPGGADVNPATTPLLNKAAFDKVLRKLASNKVADDHGTSDSIPNALRTMTADEDGKGQTAYDSTGFGNENRHLIDTDNSTAMNYDKGDAKRNYIKNQMSQVFDEVHPKKDTALSRAFEHGVDTAKMAGVADAKKMEAMAKKEVKEEKEEEKKYPGIHEEIKEAALKDIANKAKDVARRGGELLAGGKKAPMMKGNRVSDARPGNTIHGMKGKVHRTEALKSHAARAGVATAAAGGVAAATHKGKEKNANVVSQAVGLAGLGALGYHGYNKGREMAESGAQKTDDISWPGMLLATVPYGAYRLGKEMGFDKNRQHPAPKGAPAEKTAEECQCDGKGTCEVCKKAMKKAAYVLREMVKSAAGEPMMPGDPSMGGDPAAQMGTPPGAPEQQMAAQPGQEGEMDKIEQLKRLLLALQMMKQQQQMQDAGGAAQEQAPAGAPPGGPADMGATAAGPPQGVM